MLIEGISPWQLYFGLRGRIGRALFWHGLLVLALGALAVTALLMIAGYSRERFERWGNLLLLWPSLALSIKRWHDRDRSAWWTLLIFVPHIGWLWWFLETGFRPGTPGTNRFGPPPMPDPEVHAPAKHPS